MTQSSCDGYQTRWIENLLANEACRTQICKSQFRKFDTNHDGVLQWTELCELSTDLCQKMGISAGIEEDKLRAALNAFDKNHDGVLSEEEFAGLFKAFLKAALSKVNPQPTVNVKMRMLGGDLVDMADLPGEETAKDIRRRLVGAGFEHTISSDFVIGTSVVAESTQLSALMLDSLQDPSLDGDTGRVITMQVVLRDTPFQESFSFRQRPTVQMLDYFLASLTKQTKVQLDAELVNVLGHSLRFAPGSGNGYDIDPHGDKAILALLDHGATLSSDNYQRFEECKRKIESSATATADHGDADWCADVYDGPAAMIKLTQRLTMIRSFCTSPSK